MARSGYIQKTFTHAGKRYYVCGKTEKEVYTKMERKRIELDQGKVAVESSMTLSDWADICIETYKVNIKEKTRQDFIYTVNASILNLIGNLSLKDIRPRHCQEVMNRQKDKSASQISKAYQALNFLLKKAIQEKLLNENPAEFIEKPAGTTRKRRSLTESEQEVFTKIAKTDRKYYGYLLMLYCGCRPSEAYRCKREDIILVEDVNLLHIKGTKTVNADRFVPLQGWLYDLVKGCDHSEFICITSAGHKITDNYMRKMWKSYKRKINLEMGCKTYRNQLLEPYPLPPDITQYCLRHTYCTNLAKSGVDIRTAQKLMGHSDISITANIYTHIDNDDVIKAARLLDKNAKRGT